MTKLISFDAVTVDRITDAYSGANTGCTCGCKGKWYDNDTQKKRILTTLRKVAYRSPKSVLVEENQAKGGWVISHDTGSRLYILHVS